MAPLDLIILGVVGIGVWRGLVTGVLMQLAATAGIVLAFWFAAAWMEPVGAAVVSSLSLSETLAPVLGFVVTFAAVLAAVFFGTRAVQTVVEGLKLSFVNKLAGAAFGGLRAAFGLSVALLLTSAVALPGAGPGLLGDATREGSVLYAPVHAIAPAAWDLYQRVAPGIQAGLHEKFRPPDRLPSLRGRSLPDAPDRLYDGPGLHDGPRLSE